MFFGCTIKISQSLIFRRLLSQSFFLFKCRYLSCSFTFCWLQLNNFCLINAYLWVSKEISVFECLFSILSKGKHLIGIVCAHARALVCGYVCVMMHWTFCVKRNIENRECETAKPRYNLWLKSLSLHINIVNFRDASCDALYFSSRICMWERIRLNLYFFRWKMKLQNETTKRTKMKLFQIFDTVCVHSVRSIRNAATNESPRNGRFNHNCRYPSSLYSNGNDRNAQNARSFIRYNSPEMQHDESIPNIFRYKIQHHILYDFWHLKRRP